MNNNNCRIAVDAMGGDFAPRNPVLGAIDAAKFSKDIDLILVGDKNSIIKILDEENISYDRDKIVHTSEIIEMSDSPTVALKTKKDSSIVVGSQLVKENKADAFVSAGNSGAVMAAATLLIGRISGVSRPTIGAMFPTQKDSFSNVYDVGASVDSKPQHLLDYAIMGDIFVREMQLIKKPTIGMLSVGEEKSKGNELTFAATKLLEESGLNFVGNIEGRDIFKGTVDIVLCDGFVGNVVLKLAESFIGTLKVILKTYSEKSFMNKLKALVVKLTLKDALQKFDYQTHGGVPLLGVKGISIIGHGSSSPLAIKNMVLRAKEMHDKKLIQKFEESLKLMQTENRKKLYNAAISAVGMYVPEKIIDNKYLETIVDTSDEWIVSRTGIKERRKLEDGATSDMAVKAVEDLLSTSNIKAEDIDVIIVATVTPDMLFPSTACLIQEKINAVNAWGFDLSAACSGFLFGLQTGASFIESGMYKNVIVIGADKMSSILDYTDRNTCLLFGDGASAVLLQRDESNENGLIDSLLHVDGSGKESLYMKGGGSLNPASHETVDNKMHYVYQDGQAVFKVAVKGMADISAEIMEKNNLTSEDVSYLVPHQANKRIIDATGKRMGLPPEKVMLNIDKYGNTTAATIPLCLTEYYRNGKLKKGDNLILSAFGAGYTWGAIWLKWSMD